jgi:hypothetical protein
MTWNPGISGFPASRILNDAPQHHWLGTMIIQQIKTS